MVLAGGPFGLGPLELGLIVVVLVMLFGATRLADVGGSLGKGIKEFRKNIKDDDEPASPPSVSAAIPAASTGPSNGTAQTVSAVKCPSCGTVNAAGSRHCNQCGTMLVAPVS